MEGREAGPLRNITGVALVINICHLKQTLAPRLVNNLRYGLNKLCVLMYKLRQFEKKYAREKNLRERTTHHKGMLSREIKHREMNWGDFVHVRV